MPRCYICNHSDTTFNADHHYVTIEVMYDKDTEFFICTVCKAIALETLQELESDDDDIKKEDQRQ